MPFSYGFEDENIKKTLAAMSALLFGIILSQWRRSVASSKALDLLHWAMHAITYRLIAMAIKMAIFARVFVDCCLYACCPGGRWGDMEQVVPQCWRPVASRVALDMLHWAMPRSLLQCIRMAIKMACDGGTFVFHH
jgi:hypothetical protein